MSARDSSFTAERNGIYGVAGDMAEHETAARNSGLAWLGVDLAGAADKARVLRAFAQDLALPPDFGANWDALADCLQDFSWEPARGYVIELRGADAFAAASRDDCRIMLDVFQDAAMYWRQRGETFIVLIHGLPGLPSFAA